MKRPLKIKPLESLRSLKARRDARKAAARGGNPEPSSRMKTIGLAVTLVLLMGLVLLLKQKLSSRDQAQLDPPLADQKKDPARKPFLPPPRVAVGNSSVRMPNAASESEKAAQLNREGEVVPYKGALVMKISEKFREDSPEVVEVATEWNELSSRFLLDDLGISLEKERRYRELKEKVFAEYNQKVKKLREDARREFGHDVGIVLEGDLRKEYDAAQARYVQALNKLFGPSRYLRFRAFTDYHIYRVSGRLGWVPDFIR